MALPDLAHPVAKPSEAPTADAAGLFPSLTRTGAGAPSLAPILARLPREARVPASGILAALTRDRKRGALRAFRDLLDTTGIDIGTKRALLVAAAAYIAATPCADRLAKALPVLEHQAILGSADALLAKASLGRILPGEVELPEWMGALLLAAQGSALVKGAGHKYIRKVRAANGKWRYFYDVTGGRGAGHHEEFHEGAKFQLAHEGQAGHFEVVSVDGDTLRIKHDETGHETDVPKQALEAMLRREHAELFDAHKARTSRDLAAVRKHGTARQRERIEEHARKYEHTRGLIGKPMAAVERDAKGRRIGRVGDRLHYRGDMANQPRDGEITSVEKPGRFSGYVYRMKWDDGTASAIQHFGIAKDPDDIGASYRWEDEDPGGPKTAEQIAGMRREALRDKAAQDKAAAEEAEARTKATAGWHPPEDRTEAAKRIRVALKKIPALAKHKFSVRGDTGTAYGWISVKGTSQDAVAALRAYERGHNTLLVSISGDRRDNTLRKLEVSAGTFTPGGGHASGSLAARDKAQAEVPKPPAPPPVVPVPKPAMPIAPAPKPSGARGEGPRAAGAWSPSASAPAPRSLAEVNEAKRKHRKDRDVDFEASREKKAARAKIASADLARRAAEPSLAVSMPRRTDAQKQGVAMDVGGSAGTPASVDHHAGNVTVVRTTDSQGPRWRVVEHHDDGSTTIHGDASVSKRRDARAYAEDLRTAHARAGKPTREHLQLADELDRVAGHLNHSTFEIPEHLRHDFETPSSAHDRVVHGDSWSAKAGPLGYDRYSDERAKDGQRMREIAGHLRGGHTDVRAGTSIRWGSGGGVLARYEGGYAAAREKSRERAKQDQPRYAEHDSAPTIANRGMAADEATQLTKKWRAIMSGQTHETDRSKSALAARASGSGRAAEQSWLNGYTFKPGAWRPGDEDALYGLDDNARHRIKMAVDSMKAAGIRPVPHGHFPTRGSGVAKAELVKAMLTDARGSLRRCVTQGGDRYGRRHGVLDRADSLLAKARRARGAA